MCTVNLVPLLMYAPNNLYEKFISVPTILQSYLNVTPLNWIQLPPPLKQRTACKKSLEILIFFT
jgi:hypothetical protein